MGKKCIIFYIFQEFGMCQQKGHVNGEIFGCGAILYPIDRQFVGKKFRHLLTDESPTDKSFCHIKLRIFGFKWFVNCYCK